ncbi:Ig-like domain-containing protein [Haliangium ochraceum]|uniref:Cysteine-rich repeat protein n=1 Tax=Haliangium ochraceum (strain DSM 14365 / JCM 11303 / SMP-2) TaxID=502025 RepID=D0LG28_HALO1|nr:Ig-like domain-containing protein [Haliangium ochraceum]ACY14630.1 cysteine-rich repeat protein [Haliangium ochraceum DSM 14365]
MSSTPKLALLATLALAACGDNLEPMAPPDAAPIPSDPDAAQQGAPVVMDQEASTDEDTAVDITIEASDPEGDALSFTIGTPSNGAISGVAPDITYTPNADFNGSDSFSVEVSDGTLSSTATVTVTVAPVNDAPVAASQLLGFQPNTALAITLTGSDVDGDALSFTIVTQPENGTLTGDDAEQSYTPDTDFLGADSFTFVVNDGTVDSAEATVTLQAIAPGCGDGTTEAPEECDDGNNDSGDGCTAFCTLEECGDGVVNNNDEVCDDGNTEAGDGCRADCQGSEVCGDGFFDTAAGEECDDGNTAGGDGCSAQCVIECGNGVVDEGEVCDDGNTEAGDGCRADCQGSEVCGDGTTDSAAGEECDDGNTEDGDGCDSACVLENPFTSVPPQIISGDLSCSTATPHSGRKAGVDQLGRLYVVMNCGGEAFVATSGDRGQTWSDPVSTGITGVAEVALEGGAADVAFVAATVSSTEFPQGALLLARSSDGGATWGAPNALQVGIASTTVGLDSVEDSVYVSVVPVSGQIAVLRNTSSGEGAFESTIIAQTAAFFDIVVDKISGAVISGSDDPTYRVRVSNDGGQTFGPESVPPGSAFFSDWVGSNGFLYVTGSGDDNIDVIPLDAPGTSTQVAGLPLIPGPAPVRAIDADALGNAYVVTQLAAGVQLDRMLVGATAIDAGDARSYDVGTAPAVGALPSNNGALVVYTDGTSVYGAIEVY